MAYKNLSCCSSSLKSSSSFIVDNDLPMNCNFTLDGEDQSDDVEIATLIMASKEED